MIAYVSHMTAKPGARAVLLKLLQELVDTAATEPGTLVFAMHILDDDPDVVVSYELFRDSDALVAHQQTPTLTRLLPQLRDVLAVSAITRMNPVCAAGLPA